MIMKLGQILQGPIALFKQKPALGLHFIDIILIK